MRTQGPGHPVAVAPRQTLVEQLDRGRDLFLTEEPGCPRQLLKPCAVRAPDGPEGAQRAQRAARAWPWCPALLAGLLPRCDERAPDTPIPRPSPCATGRLRR